MAERAPGRFGRPVPFFVSVLIHGGLVGVLWLASSGLPQRTPSAYDQLIKGKEQQIVVYRFRKLPAVTPPNSEDARPARAEVRLPQQIVSAPKNAPKGTQVVWQPVPELLPKEVPLPNILALKAPPIPVPERKQFAPPAPVAKTVAAPAQPKLLEAPEIVKTENRLLEQLGAAPKLTVENRPRFIAPQSQTKPAATAAIQEAGAAPALQASSPKASPLSDMESSLNLAVVGLNPAEANAIPKGSRSAEFSGGPTPRLEGGTGSTGKGLMVPDLFVAGADRGEAKPTLMARLNAAPTSAEALRGMSKYAAPAGEPAIAAPRPPATRVSSAPDPRFDGREVYTMAIQMPNITSYSGSWLMWYSGRDAGRGPVAPPIAHRKVDPKYIATAAEDRVEGKVVLLCIIRQNGHVDHMELVRGIDGRLNQSAMEALAKWEFQPASRAGEPVDVDVMVEIPFRLAPRVAK